MYPIYLCINLLNHLLFYHQLDNCGMLSNEERYDNGIAILFIGIVQKNKTHSYGLLDDFTSLFFLVE